MLRDWLPRGLDGAAWRCAAERAGETRKRQEIQDVRLGPILETLETCRERRAGEYAFDIHNNFIDCAQAGRRQLTPDANRHGTLPKSDQSGQIGNETHKTGPHG
jgi:hypothetical protein